MPHGDAPLNCRADRPRRRPPTKCPIRGGSDRCGEARRGEARTAPAPARELTRFPLLTVVAGTLGIGFFFGATLTSLTGFLANGGNGDRAGLLYGVMGIGSAALALGSTAFPARFTLKARWSCSAR